MASEPFLACQHVNRDISIPINEDDDQCVVAEELPH